MSVSTQHPLYERTKFIWRSIRDAIEGTNAVKRGHEVYLPMPTGMLIEDVAPAITRKGATSNDAMSDFLPQNLPWYHTNPAYMAYLQRARFPEISAHTLRGLVGIATKQGPMFDLDNSVDYLEDRATMSGDSLLELYSQAVNEVLTTGRLVLTLDVDVKENLPYISLYQAESVINWSTTKVDGVEIITMIVFEEDDFELDDDGFSHKPVKKHRVIRLDANIDEEGNAVDGAPTRVVVKTFVDDSETESVEPSLQGKSLAEVPAIFVGAVKSDVNPGVVPMLGIAEIAYAIYRKDADLSNGEFLTCNPTLYMTGVNPDNPMIQGDGASEKVLLGSNVILKISNPAAKVAYTQTDTGGLGHVDARIQGMFTEAAEYGASMLGPMKKGVEATESLKLRQADNGATLVGVADQVSQAIESAIHMCENWMSNKPLFEDGNSEFEGNTEFAELKLSSQDITALVTTWMSHGISHETLLNRFKDAGILDEDTDIEEELDRIELEAPDEEEMEVEGEGEKGQKGSVTDGD